MVLKGDSWNFGQVHWFTFAVLVSGLPAVENQWSVRLINTGLILGTHIIAMIFPLRSERTCIVNARVTLSDVILRY